MIYILIGAVLITFVFLAYLFFSHFTKGIQIISPLGAEEWEIGRTYRITWKARGIEQVGIVLFHGAEPKWIAKNVFAKLGSHEWKIQPGQDYGDDYWIAIFEYPWRPGNEIAYSNGAFAVVYADLANCDMLSIQNERPYVSSDLPNVRRVFITERSFSGNLGGLEGADQKCRTAAQEQEFDGEWIAFLGGDRDEELAVARLRETPRKTQGIFVEAKSEATLIRGATCHRLLGRDFDDLVGKFSNSTTVNAQKLSERFLENLQDVWLGRIDERSVKSCTGMTKLLETRRGQLTERYSFTTTCQNWITESVFVEGYPVPRGASRPEFPTCYTPEGRFTEAVVLGGLSSGIVGVGRGETFTPYYGGKCSEKKHLLCIEQ